MTDKAATAFFSYTHFDDEHDGGSLTAFRERLAKEMHAQTGREFSIFQDRVSIRWGQTWKRRIVNSLDETTFYIPILTPSFFASAPCREELELFLQREQALKRDDLILPVYYITCDELDDRTVREADALAERVAAHQYADWRKLRHLPVTDRRVRIAVEGLAKQFREAMKRGPQPPVTKPSPRSRAVPVKPRTTKEKTTIDPDILPAVPKPPGAAANTKPPAIKTSAPKAPAAKTNPPKPIEAADVTESGAWLYLGGHFFLTASFNDQDDGTILVQIDSPSSEDEAVLRDLERSASRRSSPLGYAFKNRAALTDLGPVKERAVGGKSSLSFVLRPQDRTGNSTMGFAVVENGRTYSADDIAELQARLLLLNQPLPRSGQHGYSPLSLGGYDAPVKVTEALFPSIWRQYRGQPERFRAWARLTAVYYLLLSGVCEHILELRLGPVKKNEMRITFRGRRRKYYTNQEPAVITAEGICPLS